MDMEEESCSTNARESSSSEAPSKMAACSLAKSMDALLKQQPELFAVGCNKALHDLIVKWTLKEPEMETDVPK